MDKQIPLAAGWTPDCQGKQDYDGKILSVSTRYWPRGGGYFVVENFPGQPVKIEGNEARPEQKPSAHSSLIINEQGGNYYELVEKSFEAETEQEVKTQVEKWAQEQMDKAVKVLADAFGGLKEPD